MLSWFVSLELRCVALSGGACDLISCPECDVELALHQPDLDRPERLVGSCESCRDWFVIDYAAGVLLGLPRAMPGAAAGPWDDFVLG